MRALWELLKRFPAMPPFGEAWFAALREMDSPIAILRLEWIYLSIAEDRRIDHERSKDDIEYGGLCAQPGALAAIKGWNAEEEQSLRGEFKLQYDTTAFDTMFHQAMTDRVVMKPQRVEVAERVKRKRLEQQLAGSLIPPAQPRQETSGPDVDDEYDALTIE